MTYGPYFQNITLSTCHSCPPEAHSGEPAMVLLMLAGATCAVTLLGAPWYLGLLRSIQFTEMRMEPAVFLFLPQVGPYKNVGSIFAKLIPLLPRLPAGIQTAFIPMDSPQEVEASKLRCMCGLWLPVTLRSEVDGILKTVSEAGGLNMSVREIRGAIAKHTFFSLEKFTQFHAWANESVFGRIYRLGCPTMWNCGDISY